jgi:hypothetical protein
MSRGKNTRRLVCAAVALASGPLLAGEKCYDFSKMTVGTSYRIGDELDISIGKVKIREFIKNGGVLEPTSGIDQHLEITQSRLAQEASPEVSLTLVGMQVIPREPVQEVSMLVAQQLGVGGNLPAYIEINGEKHDFSGSFIQAHDKVLGNVAQGRARFKADLVQDAAGSGGPSYWHRGRMGARAVSGGIESITIGGQAVHLDQICFKR